MKALLTTLYLATAALWLLHWEDILPYVAGAAGLSGLLKGVKWLEWLFGARALAEAGFVLLALAVLIRVAFDVSARHHSTSVNDSDGGRARE